ncbi:hypothetical protein J0A68_10380 [Algoriphagus sp. H41]|uniref:Uncharacterized protein n=1 Tax=Algoriphagus oliviformis TaxID=2811231 RepID=A0ABS3C338_9BACT|nr:hypothetical protein [Algoriphagus oliviformis]MBN7811367.1 hypothetical protein [Algoriphagus oliviformis]
MASFSKMKKGFLFLQMVVFSACYGQNSAQRTVEFYAQNILPTKNGIVVRYDGRIEKADSSYNELAHLILVEFYRCKADPRGDNNDDLKIDSDEWVELSMTIRKEVFISRPMFEGRLISPPNIKSRKNLKYKDLKGGFVRYYPKNLFHRVFPVKFNLTVEPIVSYNGSDYVWLKVSKNDLEYGSWYFFELNEQTVLDWCEIGWIQ